MQAFILSCLHLLTPLGSQWGDVTSLGENIPYSLRSRKSSLCLSLRAPPGGWCGSGSLSCQHSLVVTRGCLLCCVTQEVSTASTGFCLYWFCHDEWARGRWEKVGSWVCSFAFLVIIVVIIASLKLPHCCAVSPPSSLCLAMALAKMLFLPLLPSWL